MGENCVPLCTAYRLGVAVEVEPSSLGCGAKGEDQIDGRLGNLVKGCGVGW